MIIATAEAPHNHALMIIIGMTFNDLKELASGTILREPADSLPTAFNQVETDDNGCYVLTCLAENPKELADKMKAMIEKILGHEVETQVTYSE